jgi:hypothetical protein
VEWKLSTEVPLNFVDALGVSGLGQVRFETPGIVLEQELAAAQILPPSGPNRWRNSLPAPFFHLHDNESDTVHKPVRYEHRQFSGSSFSSEYELKSQTVNANAEEQLKRAVS